MHPQREVCVMEVLYFLMFMTKNKNKKKKQTLRILAKSWFETSHISLCVLITGKSWGFGSANENNPKQFNQNDKDVCCFAVLLHRDLPNKMFGIFGYC